MASISSQPNDQASASNVLILQPTHIARYHPLNTIICDISRGVQTRSRLASFCKHFSFVSSIEPKKIYEALKDVDWVIAMHEELNNFTRNQVWELVERHKDLFAPKFDKLILERKRSADDVKNKKVS